MPPSNQTPTLDDLVSCEDGHMEIRLPEGFVPQALLEAHRLAESGQIERASQTLDLWLGAGPVDLEGRSTRAGLTQLLTAMTCQALGRADQAERFFSRAVTVLPHPAALNEAARFHSLQGDVWRAVACRREALEVEPGNTVVRANLGLDLVQAGHLQEGIEQLRQAVQDAPASPVIGSMWVSALHYLPRLDREVLFSEHREWGQRHAPVSLAARGHGNDPHPHRRLRTGYVSPDFHRHSAAYFFEPVLDGRDRQAVEVYGYGNVARPDAVTARLASKFDHYQSVRGLSDEEVVERIRQDRIDILVDLAGHWRGHRLGVFASRPAPIQVTYLGYPDTTGLEQMDYRLTDPCADMPDAQRFHTEDLVSLAGGFLCYRPPDDAPVVGPLPALASGQVTFGSFNNNSKINEEVVGTWARLLQKDKRFRLLLKFKGGDEAQVRGHYLGQFGQHGIVEDRVQIEGWCPEAKHLGSYNNVDIALDTFPYNGTTTTCEAMWMGVPTLTLVGSHHCSRVGYSLLHQVGLEAFVASTPDEYLNKAVSCAGQLDHLAVIRRSLRPMMLASPLCDARGLAQGLEKAFRWMWQQWVVYKTS